jgi:hypothetical protein
MQHNAEIFLDISKEIVLDAYIDKMNVRVCNEAKTNNKVVI